MARLRPRNANAAASRKQGTKARDWPSTGSEGATNDSPFLKLPPELRNKIYEYAAQNEDAFSMRKDRTLCCPPLSLVCKQSRQEYEAIYLDEAPKYATKINVHTTHLLDSEAAFCVDKIETLAPSVERTFTLRVFLPKTCFPSLLRHLSKGYALNHPSPLARGGPLTPGSRPYDIEIHFDPKTFPVEPCQHALLNFDQAISKYDEVAHDFSFRYRDWPKVEQAFWEAFERYEVKDQEDDETTQMQGRKLQRVGERSPRVKKRRRL